MSLYIGTTKIKNVNVMFVEGDGSNIVEENIKSGIRILGVDGNFTADGTQSTGYDVANSENILSGHSAWVDGKEVLGTLDINYYYYGTSEPASDLGNDGDIYLKA